MGSKQHGQIKYAFLDQHILFRMIAMSGGATMAWQLISSVLKRSTVSSLGETALFAAALILPLWGVCFLTDAHNAVAAFFHSQEMGIAPNKTNRLLFPVAMFLVSYEVAFFLETVATIRKQPSLAFKAIGGQLLLLLVAFMIASAMRRRAIIRQPEVAQWQWHRKIDATVAEDQPKMYRGLAITFVALGFLIAVMGMARTATDGSRPNGSVAIISVKTQAMQKDEAAKKTSELSLTTSDGFISGRMISDPSISAARLITLDARKPYSVQSVAFQQPNGATMPLSAIPVQQLTGDKAKAAAQRQGLKETDVVWAIPQNIANPKLKVIVTKTPR